MRVGGDIPPPLAVLLVKPPFDTEKRIPHSAPITGAAIAFPNVGHLILELNSVAETIVDVQKGRLDEAFSIDEDRRVSDVDLPVSITWGAWVVREQGRSALAENGQGA